MVIRANRDAPAVTTVGWAAANRALQRAADDMGETEGTKALATDDPFDFLAPDDAPIEAPVTAEPIAEPAPLDPAAPIAEVPAVDPAAPVAPAAIVPPKAPEGYLPLAAVLDEREKRQKTEKERDDYRLKYEATLKPAAAPDVASDPQAWAAEQQRLREEDRMAQKMEMSGFTASQHYGEEKLSAAKTWGAEQNASDPYFGPAFMAQKYPFQWLVAKHREAQAAAWVGGKSPEERSLEYAISLGYQKPLDGAAPLTQQPAPAPVVASPSPKPAPPRSIVGAAPAGGTNAQVVLGEAEVGDIWSK